MKQIFSANLAALLLSDGQPLLDRDGQFVTIITASFLIIWQSSHFFEFESINCWIKLSFCRSGRRWCWSRTRTSSLTLFKTISMGRHPPRIRRPGLSGEHLDPWSWSLILDPDIDPWSWYWSLILDPDSCDCLIWLFKVQVQLRVRGFSTTGGVWQACIHWSRQPARKFSNKVRPYC